MLVTFRQVYAVWARCCTVMLVTFRQVYAVWARCCTVRRVTFRQVYAVWARCCAVILVTFTQVHAVWARLLCNGGNNHHYYIYIRMTVSNAPKLKHKALPILQTCTTKTMHHIAVNQSWTLIFVYYTKISSHHFQTWSLRGWELFTYDFQILR